jgi:hypothetical protein
VAEWDWITTLIEGEGRTCTLSKFSTETDASKPWRTTVIDPDDVDTASVHAVFVHYRKSQIDGELIQVGDEMAILDGVVAADTYDLLIDGSITWKIVRSEIIAPGAEILLYIMQLRR